MRQVVRDDFFNFTVKREGFTPFMYADVLNLVTTGVGNLIDSGPNNPGPDTRTRARLNNVVSPAAMFPAMGLPWKFKGPGWTKDNPVALEGIVSQSAIADVWTTVKRQNEAVPDFSQKGGFAYQNLTPLTLDMNGIKTLFSSTLTSFDRKLALNYPGYETWPADAQKALLSMSWAMGPNFHTRFPAFKAAVDRRNFDAAAPLSFFKGGGGTESTPTGRNAENQIMFHNAAAVERSGVDPDRLYFPGTIDGSRNTGIEIASSPVKVVGAVAAAGAVAVGGWKIFDWWRNRK